MTDHLLIADAPVVLTQQEDRPTDYAARLHAQYCAAAPMGERRELGQFFTPISVARFMADLARTAINGRRHLRILEPGAGTAVLTAAVCEALAQSVESMEIDLYEIHPQLASLAEETLRFTAEWLKERGVRLTFIVHRCDFIATHAGSLTSNLFPSVGDGYDLAIANPPYFKLQKNDPRSRAASHIVHGQPNIYAIFMAIMATLLHDNGSMVTITPRSFAAGDYFRRFRHVLFSSVTPEAIHLFTSRRDAFRRDEVLQENVIVQARRAAADDVDRRVRVSASEGVSDLERSASRLVALTDVVDITSREMAVHIATNEVDDEVLRLVHAWPETLQSLGLRVSTGPVVAFRARQFLRGGSIDGETIAPLLWLQHIRSMVVQWPLGRANKLEYILDSEESAYLVVPNRTYVILRRFSAKEERRRIIAAPLIGHTLPGDMLGLENHLNYIHRPKGAIQDAEAIGLAALLSSAIVDRYFRISNGNTQVSAVELRHLPLPTRATIVEIGRLITQSSPTELDRAVIHALHVPANLCRELERGANGES